MNVCIVTTRHHLHFINSLVDQNNVRICAIITDDRIFAVESGCPKNITYAYWQFREVIQSIQPDYILFLTPAGFHLTFQPELKAINYPVKNVCVMSDYANSDSLELVALFNEFAKSSERYTIMVSGNSYMYSGILPEEFELPLFNFAMESQDLYYDYQIAKIILSARRINTFKYALIGLAPYVLHYDLSRSTFPVFRLPKYFYALNDLHNFGIDIDTVRSFFDPIFLKNVNEQELIFDYSHTVTTDTISTENALQAVTSIRKWNSKNYPDTVKENKQIFENYLSLLDQYKIKPILVFPPMVKEYQENFAKNKLNEIESFLIELNRRHSFEFINFWAIDIFDEHDFWDLEHVNFSGAKKFSKILNDVIMQLEGNNL